MQKKLWQLLRSAALAASEIHYSVPTLAKMEKSQTQWSFPVIQKTAVTLIREASYLCPASLPKESSLQLTRAGLTQDGTVFFCSITEKTQRVSRQGRAEIWAERIVMEVHNLQRHGSK